MFSLVYGISWVFWVFFAKCEKCFVDTFPNGQVLNLPHWNIYVGGNNFITNSDGIEQEDRMCLKGFNADHNVTSMGSTAEDIYSIIWNKVFVLIKCLFSSVIYAIWLHYHYLYFPYWIKQYRENRNIQDVLKTTPVLMFWYISLQLACMAYFPKVYLIACLHDFLNLVELR